MLICVQIGNLARELCLDRALVLELLRAPPPNLVMMSAALLDEPSPVMLPVAESNKPVDSVPLEMVAADTVKSEGEKNSPVHVMRHQWSAQKRLQKVQVESLERVYGRTKRPTVSRVFCGLILIRSWLNSMSFCIRIVLWHNCISTSAS